MIMENYYSLTDEKIIQARKRAQKLCVEYNEKVNQKNFYDEALLNTLLKKVGRDPYVEPNFRCFLGSRIELGDEVFLNHDVTLQDMAEITIGNNVNIAPRTGIFTEFCPKDKELRRQKTRYAKPVVIEDGVWLGGNVTVWGGVTIGKNSIIGAGSVVTANIPENVIAVGNPAKVIKKSKQTKSSRPRGVASFFRVFKTTVCRLIQPDDRFCCRRSIPTNSRCDHQCVQAVWQPADSLRLQRPSLFHAASP